MNIHQYEYRSKCPIEIQVPTSTRNYVPLNFSRIRQRTCFEQAEDIYSWLIIYVNGDARLACQHWIQMNRPREQTAQICIPQKNMRQDMKSISHMSYERSCIPQKNIMHGMKSISHMSYGICHMSYVICSEIDALLPIYYLSLLAKSNAQGVCHYPNRVSAMGRCLTRPCHRLIDRLFYLAVTSSQHSQTFHEKIITIQFKILFHRYKRNDMKQLQFLRLL